MPREDEVMDVLAGVVKMGRHEIKMDEKLSISLGVDSTEMVELVVALEKKLGLDIPDGELSHENTPREIVSAIEAHLG